MGSGSVASGISTVSSEPRDTLVVDLNSDLGEGFGVWTLGDDTALLDVITSANLACGFHAGDPNIMRRVCEAAVSRGVAIGAQVGYQDLAGFGRRSIDIDAASLTNDVIYQLGARVRGCAMSSRTAPSTTGPCRTMIKRRQLLRRWLLTIRRCHC